MVGVIDASSPVPKLYQFFAAMEYQHHFLMKEAGLCKHLPYDELKKIALESGTATRKSVFYKEKKKKKEHHAEDALVGENLTQMGNFL